jgi:hypothetical protein
MCSTVSNCIKTCCYCPAETLIRFLTFIYTSFVSCICNCNCYEFVDNIFTFICDRFSVKPELRKKYQRNNLVVIFAVIIFITGYYLIQHHLYFRLLFKILIVCMYCGYIYIFVKCEFHENMIEMFRF